MRREPHRRNLRARYRPQHAPTFTSLVQARLQSFSPSLDMTRQYTIPVAVAPARRRRYRWSAKRTALVGIPLLLLAVVAVFAFKIVIQTQQAYNKIFVTAAPHLRVALNAEGTPVVLTNDSTPAPADFQGSSVQPIAGATPEVGAVDTPAPGSDLPDWDKKERVNILLLGIDELVEGLPSRSDTMIIVTINPATKQVGMLSVPRDLLVSIPNYGNDKINAAYAYGSSTPLTGAGLARATVEYNFGIQIHYVVEVDFSGFQKIVDTLGGVTIDAPAPIKDDEYPSENYNYTRVYVHTGLQHLNGQQALRYARTRHDDNDFARGSRQQQVLLALRQQGLRLNLITKASELLNNLGDTFRTDLSPTQALALAKLGNSIGEENIRAYDMQSVTTVSWPPGGAYYLVPDWKAVRAILADMMSH